MLKNLEIQNLRGISHCLIDDLGQVNLFLGQNNCGKSTILESLFLLTGGAIPYNYQKINNLRSCSIRGGEDFILNFYGLRKEVPISIKSDVGDNSRILTISYSEKTLQQVPIGEDVVQINDELPKNYSVSFKLVTENGKVVETKMSNTASVPNTIKVKSVKGEDLNIPAFFISPAEPYDNVENYYSQAIENKQENTIESIVKLVDNSVCDLKFANGRIMVDVGFEKRIPVQLMGDGMKKVLSVVVNMSLVRDGVILIDEIDNGLHYSSMPILWKAIIEAAKENNVQVFATTHNIDSIRALDDVLSLEEYGNMRSAFRSYTILKENGGERRAVKTSFSQFNHIINQELELR